MNYFAHGLRFLYIGTKIDVHPGFGVLLDMLKKKTGVRQGDGEDISKRQTIELRTKYECGQRWEELDPSGNLEGKID